MESPAVYSRAEIEALRFADIAAQTTLWKSIYNSLESSVRKAYDDLSTSRRIRTRPPKNQLSPPIPSLDDEVALEGNESGDEDESDEEYSIQRPAFFVDGEPDFDSGPPEDGLEYLRRVRWEAAKIPKFRVAKLDKNKFNEEQSDYMPKIPEISKCPEHLHPSKQWEDSFLAEFSQLRLALSRLDISSFIGSKEHQSPATVAEERCYDLLSDHIMLDSSGKTESELPDSSDPANENDQLSTDEDNIISAPVDKPVSTYPLLSVISKMDSVARVSMLKKHVLAFQDMETLPRNDCLWIFALCAVVDSPLDSDTCASLRSLLRKSASLLAKKSQLDDEVVMLNILATVSGKYFGQLGF